MAAPDLAEDSRAHYLRPAGRTHTPPAVILLDSETRQHDVDGQEIHTLRCWDACMVYRRDRRRQGEVAWSAGQTAAEAAQAIDSWCHTVESAWLYAHNVGFDMVVTNLPAELVALGWELSSRFGLGSGVMWLVLHKGRRVTARADASSRGGAAPTRVKWAHTLTIADSVSLFPKPLGELDQHTPVAKPPLPGPGAPAEAWAARCHADTDILRHLVCDLMDWWDANDMGSWSVTGAALGWQTYRRTLGPREMVIDHDPAVIAWERQAIYGGRRDVFRVGQLTPGRYGEVDFEAAYPTIAATYPLPARIACRITDAHRVAAVRGRVPAGMLAEVTITTDSPRWPMRTPLGIFYPVGTFRTVLAAPDIKAAADAGALAAVHDGYLYTMTGHLRPWARQVLRWADQHNGAVPGAVRVAAKLWSRAVIGKFGQKGWRTDPYYGPPSDAWVVEDVIRLDGGPPGMATGLCGTWYVSYPTERGEHERPAVLAFVEAHVRARLGQVIAGPFGAAVVQCDTDGVMVSHVMLRQLAGEAGRRWRRGEQVPLGHDHVLSVWNEASWPLVMRDKTEFTRAVIYGPQHVILDGKPRMAGLPRGAWSIGGDRWAARLWPGLLWQSQREKPGEYARPVQPYLIVGPYAQGWVLADGTVRPVEAVADLGGTNHVQPWEKTRWAAAGDQLGPSQAKWTERIGKGTEDESCRT